MGEELSYSYGTGESATYFKSGREEVGKTDASHQGRVTAHFRGKY